MVLAPERAWVPERLDAPLFAPLAAAFAPLRGLPTWPSVAEIDAALSKGLTNASGRPLRFVPLGPKGGRRRGPRSRDTLYDALIDGEGCVPTRERSWHDLFNALVWATFPRAKATLSRRQHAALKARLPEVFDRLPSARTEEQDALTLLDEGGALVVVAHEDEAGVRERLIAGAHDELAGARVLVFGHAVYEHALSTDAPLRVGAHLVAVERAVLDRLDAHAPDALRAVDARLAAQLERDTPRSIGGGLPLERWL
ncbi:MAG: DUF3025 domain-containing protein [Myxococcales bacterium]|nr:DUF3025 domain-containing protein [Myxococcales bacterium]